MSAAVQTPEHIDVAIRPWRRETELRFVQASWADGLRPSRCRDVPKHHVRVLDQQGIFFNGHTYRRDDFVSQLHLGRLDDLLDVSRPLWARAARLLIDSLLETATVVVATLPEDDNPVGWAAHTEAELHFVHVVPVARRSQIARQLMAHTGCSSASFVTARGRPLLRYLRGSQG